ncbi:adenosine nucleotide hydrolase NudE [Salinisphaera sp. PC39]
MRTAARSRLFHIESVNLRFGNGREVEYERLAGERPARKAVIIVPVLDRRTLLLIREYAVGIEEYVLGLAQGMVDRGETLAQAANRELMEEVGYGARRISRLCTLDLAPNYLSYRTDVVLAEDLYPRALPGDEPEPLEVVPWPLADLPGLLRGGRVTEARSVAALFLARMHLEDAAPTTGAAAAPFGA